MKLNRTWENTTQCHGKYVYVLKNVNFEAPNNKFEKDMAVKVSSEDCHYTLFPLPT
jgi:hypothetical protein